MIFSLFLKNYYFCAVFEEKELLVRLFKTWDCTYLEQSACSPVLSKFAEASVND